MLFKIEDFVMFPDVVCGTVVHGGHELSCFTEQLADSFQRIACCRYGHRAVPDRTRRAHQCIEQA
ncbi:hypothetical protein D3C81_2056660 [compost metagenome]